MSTDRDLLPLGRIVRLQIQRSPLKLGEKPNRRYDPAPILAVDRLTVTPDGAEARLPGGTVLLDVHHIRHPQTRNNGGGNTFSVGFTAHYALMRAQFGEHATPGCAGENILVETDRRIELADLERGLVIQATRHASPITLTRVMVAAPCKPFTGYLLRRLVDSDTLKRSLQFLDGGLRGFYASLAQAEPAVISVGDQVFSLPR